MSAKTANVSNATFKDREKPQEVRKANILAARGMLHAKMSMQLAFNSSIHNLEMY